MISEDQYGFRASKSTSDANIPHLDFAYSYLDIGSMVVSFFLGFKKAIDCVDHSNFLAKLDSLGVRDAAK